MWRTKVEDRLVDKLATLTKKTRADIAVKIKATIAIAEKVALDALVVHASSKPDTSFPLVFGKPELSGKITGYEGLSVSEKKEVVDAVGVFLRAGGLDVVQSDYVLTVSWVLEPPKVVATETTITPAPVEKPEEKKQ